MIMNWKVNLNMENNKIPYDRLLEIAKSMHLWIFLHSDDEQKVYDELKLTNEENAILGYGGQYKFELGDKDEEDNSI